MFTKNEKFRVSIFKDNGDEDERTLNLSYVSPDKLNFLVVHDQDMFTIEMYSEDTVNHYASKLFIDGKEYKHKKTFKKIGRYLGFKKGHGVYDRFVFKKPEIYNSETMSPEEIELHNKAQNYFKPAIIKIQFFKTIEVKEECRLKNPTKAQSYYSSRIVEDKKYCHLSSTVGKGTQVDFNTHDKWVQNVYNKNAGKMISNFIIDETQQIDEIEINYSDYVSLTLLGVISPYNIKHLYLYPLNPEYLKKALKALISHFEKTKDKDDIHISYVQYHYDLLTGHYLEDYLKKDHNMTLKDYFINNFDSFRLDCKGNVQVNNFSPDLYLDKEFQSNNFIQYCTTAKEKVYLGNKLDWEEEVKEAFVLNHRAKKRKIMCAEYELTDGKKISAKEQVEKDLEKMPKPKLRSRVILDKFGHTADVIFNPEYYMEDNPYIEKDEYKEITDDLNKKKNKELVVAKDEKGNTILFSPKVSVRCDKSIFEKDTNGKNDTNDTNNLNRINSNADNNTDLQLVEDQNSNISNNNSKSNNFFSHNNKLGDSVLNELKRRKNNSIRVNSSQASMSTLDKSKSLNGLKDIEIPNIHSFHTKTIKNDVVLGFINPQYYYVDLISEDQ